MTRATSRVNDIENPSGTRGAWAEEVAFGVNKSRTDPTPPATRAAASASSAAGDRRSGPGRLWPHRLLPHRRHQGSALSGRQPVELLRGRRRRLLAGPARRPARRRPGGRRLSALRQPARAAAEGRQAAMSPWTGPPRPVRPATPPPAISASAIRPPRSGRSISGPQVHGDYFYLNQGAYHRA